MERCRDPPRERRQDHPAAVPYLGEIANGQQMQWSRALEACDEGTGRMTQIALFPEDRTGAVQVRLKDFELHRPRQWGACWLALGLWEPNRRSRAMRPDGNPAPGPKFDDKLRWLERLASHAPALVALDAPVILAGDFNVMPTDLDVYKPERWRKDALFRPEVRSVFHSLIARLDRRLAVAPPERGDYTFWDYFRNAGTGMPVYGSIISFSTRSRTSTWQPQMPIVTCAAGRRPAITRRYG